MGNFINYIIEFILLMPVLLISLSVHEYSHGRASYLLGDPTPKMQGRLTLNPLAHLDPVGTIVLLITQRVGWAKPVQINPRYYNNPRKGMMYVGLAGPVSNYVLAVIFALIFRFTAFLIGINPVLLFNNVMINMDSFGYLGFLIYMISIGIIINVSLGTFNLLPVPPLDGSKILRGFLPPSFDKYFYKLEGPLGMVLVLFLVMTGLLSRILVPIINFALNILL